MQGKATGASHREANLNLFGENPKPWRSLKLKSRNRGSSTSQRLEVYNPTNDSEYPARR